MPLQIFPDIYADYTLRCYFKKNKKQNLCSFIQVKPKLILTQSIRALMPLTEQNNANLLQYLKIIYFNKSYLLDRPILVCT